MAKLTKPQQVRLFLGRWVYRALWWPAVGVAVPVALIAYALEWMAEHVAKPAFGGWHDIALAAGNAVFGKAARAALTKSETHSDV